MEVSQYWDRGRTCGIVSLIAIVPWHLCTTHLVEDLSLCDLW